VWLDGQTGNGDVLYAQRQDRAWAERPVERHRARRGQLNGNGVGSMAGTDFSLPAMVDFFLPAAHPCRARTAGILEHRAMPVANQRNRRENFFSRGTPVRRRRGLT
jgi:hypothetical protein